MDVDRYLTGVPMDLFQPHVILPAQHFNPPKKLAPEHRLLMAVLDDAVGALRSTASPQTLEAANAVAARRGATLAVFLRAHLRGSRSRREHVPPPAIGAGATTGIVVARDADADTRTLSDVGMPHVAKRRRNERRTA